jgi:DNA-binding NtrC family response regulator
MQPKHSAGTIVSVGQDPQLLSLRETILTMEGFRVLTATDEPTARSFIEKSDCHVLLLCYSLAIQLRQRLVNQFRKLCPTGRIVVITNEPLDRPPLDADAFVYGIEGPKALIAVITDDNQASS